MTKTLIFLPFLILFFIGCASTVDTANMTSDQRFKYAMDFYNDEEYDRAIQEFDAIMLQFPGNEIVDDAQFYLAKCRLARTEYILAASEFSRLIRNMPASSFVPESQYNLAECYYKLSPPFPLDQRYTKKGIEEFQAYIDFFPTDPKVPEAEVKIKELNDKLAHKAFNAAVIYEKMDYNIAAVAYYDNVETTYFDTQYAPMASYNKINVLIGLKRNNEALKEIENFLIKYPQDANYIKVEELKTKLEKSDQETASK
jgi:outer membrane protein assembly factor BamD